MPRPSTSVNWRDAPDPGLSSPDGDGFLSSSDDERDNTSVNVTAGLLKRLGGGAPHTHLY